MKRKDNYKNNLKCAFAGTFFIAMMLFSLIMNSAKGKSMEIVMLVTMPVMVLCTIWIWIKGTRQYIDHRLKEIVKEPRINTN